MTDLNATPLIGLDAVVVDTETTGPDAAKAWVIEVGAVPLHAGVLEGGGAYSRRLKPPDGIPPAATAIHGIDDAAVADAPSFGASAGEIAGRLDARVMIGHSLGFDLAVLDREFRRAGVPWQPPRGLCTRMLAQVAEPALPDYALETVAARLGVVLEGRHSAAGDALTAGLIFVALLPKLRERGIRTLAEAERACAGLTEVLDAQHRAGWSAVAEAPRPAATPDRPQADLYPYRNRVGAVMNVPAFIGAGRDMREAVARMTAARISSLLVGEAQDASPAATGIVTERDVMRAVATHGAAALDMPVGSLASRPLLAVPADAFTYRAIARMNRLGVRHLGVTGEDGRLAGVVSARDLLRQRAQAALWLGDEIDTAIDAAGLSRAWAKLPAAVSALRREGIGGIEAAALVSAELRALTGRAAALAEDMMRSAGQGGPPCRYAVAVLGSAGRGESLLALDQDNALIFDGAPDDDGWFAVYGGHLADILNQAGVPYCKGGVMASQPAWRGTVASWRERVAHWLATSDPRQLLSVDIAFDLRGVHGDVALADALRRDLFDSARGRIDFAKLLAESAGSVAPGLRLFGRFRTREGRIDLKKTGLFGIVTAARVLAIRHHILAATTAERLEAVREMGIGGEADLEALLAAQATFLDLIVDQQIDDIGHGIPPSNAVAIGRLSRRDRERLRTAFHAVQHLDALTRDLLFKE